MYGNAARDDLWSKLSQVTRSVRSGVPTWDCSPPPGGGERVEGSRGQGLYRRAETLVRSRGKVSLVRASDWMRFFSLVSGVPLTSCRPIRAPITSESFPVCLVIHRHVTKTLVLHTPLQAMRSEGRDIDIGQMMDRWTLQMGYPVVTISKNQSEQLATHHATISQEHFLYGQELRSSNRLDL